MTNAMMNAVGPGTADTVWPASSTTRTSREPGSEMPGVPASVINVTVSPASSSDSTSRPRSVSVCSLHTASRTPLMPA